MRYQSCTLDKRYVPYWCHYILRILREDHSNFVVAGIMTQHQTELFELQCLLRNTQERLQVQVQTTVDQVR